MNGIADPTVAGGEDATHVAIVSAPVFRVQKLSTYLGGTNVLVAGDKLRYSITVKNISNAGAVNVLLRDAVPANTAYVGGQHDSEWRGGRGRSGHFPADDGALINSPADLTPGSMPADASSSQANVATIAFSVVVNPNTPNGTLILQPELRHRPRQRIRQPAVR